VNNCSLPLYSTMTYAFTLGNLATLDQRRKKISPRLHVAPHQAFEFVAKPSDGIHAVYLVALEAMRIANYEPKEYATLHVTVRYPGGRHEFRKAVVAYACIRPGLQLALGDDVTLTVTWDGSKDVSEGAVVNVREVV